MSQKELIEKLAEVEHEQWMAWSKDISKKEKLTEERYLRWRRLWVPYNQLTEDQKDQDRKWAKKVMEIIKCP